MSRADHREVKHHPDYSYNDDQGTKRYTFYTFSARPHGIDLLPGVQRRIAQWLPKTVYILQTTNQSCKENTTCPLYDELAFLRWFYLFASLLLRCAGGVGRWGKGLLWAGAGIRHNRESACSQKDVKRYEGEVLGDGGLVGRPGDAVVASPALLLDLDYPDTSAVTAEAAVLPGAAVTRGGVRTACWVMTAAFLLGSTHLCRQTVKGRAAFMLMTDFVLIALKVELPEFASVPLFSPQNK